MSARSHFKIGSLYYECGLVTGGRKRSVPWITTWIYVGYVRTPGRSSKSCDKPEHFYHFLEFEPRMAHILRSQWKRPGAYIPSLRQAVESRVTWDELWSSKLPKLAAEFAEERKHHKPKAR